MEIEKVIRTLSGQDDYDSVRAILLLLSDDYVRSTNEDARKGGAVALAACAIGLKKANDGGGVGGGGSGSNNNVVPPSAGTSAGADGVEYAHVVVAECRDLILASVVHACQDHSQRVRYYATESLFKSCALMINNDCHYAAHFVIQCYSRPAAAAADDEEEDVEFDVGLYFFLAAAAELFLLLLSPLLSSPR
jgi:hypothetical protein